jgi:hypothetical protein
MSNSIVSRPTRRSNLGDPLLLNSALLVLLEDQRGALQKFGLPMGQHLRVELVLPTEFGGTMRSTHQVEHNLRFELGCKCSSLCHLVSPSWFKYTSWLSLRQVSNPRGALRGL